MISPGRARRKSVPPHVTSLPFPLGLPQRNEQLASYNEIYLESVPPGSTGWEQRLVIYSESGIRQSWPHPVYGLAAIRFRISAPRCSVESSAAKLTRKWESCWLKTLPGMINNSFSIALDTNSAPVPQGALMNR